MWTRETRGTDQKDLQGCSTVHRTLPVGDERTGWNVQGRVAVRHTLPLDVERTVLERSGPSGSATGTFRGEWQCAPHCHSGVSVPGRAPYTATRCRAYRVGTLGAEWQCDRNARGRVAVRPERSGAEWQCDRDTRMALLASDGVSLFGFALPRAGAARHAPDAQSHLHSVRQLRAQTRERYQDPPTRWSRA